MKDTRTLPETQASGSGPGILDRIVATKEAEVERLLQREAELRSRAADVPAPRDLGTALKGGGHVAVMAEVKRRSPGAGPIRPGLDAAETARAYEEGGAAAVSVLTDGKYFGGGLPDLEDARKGISIPVFRKDFVIHPVQLAEARAAGADGVLLIVRILSEGRLVALLAEAAELGLAALTEVHGGEELDQALAAGSRIIGVNNRNLQTFRTSLDVTLDLLPRIPRDVTVVSESGIRTAADVDRLGARGVDAVLVGESLLRAHDPLEATRALVGRARTPRGRSGQPGGMES